MRGRRRGGGGGRLAAAAAGRAGRLEWSAPCAHLVPASGREAGAVQRGAQVANMLTAVLWQWGWAGPIG